MSRTTVVTGAASGIGQALTGILTERGERVITVDLRDADVCADLATPEGRESALAGIRELAGDRLDGVVTCAGLSDWKSVTVRVNYFGTVRLLVGLQPLLAAADAPRAALVGSISGTQPTDPALVAACLADDEVRATELADVAEKESRGPQIYASSKAALAQWARRTCTTPEWAGAGIPLNVVAPGVVRTPMSAWLFADEAMKKVMDEAVPMPLHGYADAVDLARPLAYLVSEDNNLMTGQVIYVDGGAEASLRPADHF